MTTRTKILGVLGGLCVALLFATAAEALDIDTVFHGRLVVGLASSYAAVTCATATADGEACIQGDLETNGALDVAGASTLTGAVGVAGLITTTGGLTTGALNAIVTTDTLTSADCGKITTVSAAVDATTITLPEASTVIGCTFTLMYIGADGGALLDISPLDSDADGIEGQCKAANGTTVSLSGTADADIGFTKATIETGNTMAITAVSAAMFVMHDVTGICANN